MKNVKTATCFWLSYCQRTWRQEITRSSGYRPLLGLTHILDARFNFQNVHSYYKICLIIGVENECFDPGQFGFEYLITLDFQGQKSERFLKCNDEDSRMYKRTNHRRKENQLKSCYQGNWPEENMHIRVSTCHLLVEFEVRTVYVLYTVMPKALILDCGPIERRWWDV